MNRRQAVNGTAIFAAQAEVALSCDPPGPDESVREVIRKSLYVQYDPLSTVAPSHYIALFARNIHLRYDDVATSLTLENGVVEVWVRVASFVNLADFTALGPEFRRRREGPLRYGERRRVGQGIDEAGRSLMRLLEAEGPMTASEAEARMGTGRQVVSTWKTSVTRTVLNYLWYRGYVVIVGRGSGQQPRFDTVKRAVGVSFDGPFDPFDFDALLRQLVTRMIDCLVAATPTEIAWYLGQSVSIVRGIVDRLCQDGAVQAVDIVDSRSVYYATERGLQAIRRHEEMSRVSGSDEASACILSPFDTLIAHRDRLETLTQVRFRAELFTPAKQRSGAASYPLMILTGFQPSKILWLRSDRQCGVLRILGSEVLRGQKQFSPQEVDAIRRLAIYLGLGVPPQGWEKGGIGP